MKIDAIDQHSPHLATVKALGRMNAATLGFFPEGAFDEHAAKGRILVAVGPSGVCIGYLLYRTTRGRATIVHLCVDSPYRGFGTAEALVTALRHRTRGLRGIALLCRRDFPAYKLWPKLGFCALYDKPGRGRDPKNLTFWWLDHGHPDLFTTADMQRLETKIPVMIDANVFFDLHDQSDPESEESQALLADWLRAEIELCITDELWNEINRNPDLEERNRQRALAHSFTQRRSDMTRFEATCGQLRSLFTTVMSERDESDLREVARTIAADVQFFVTRDAALLDKGDSLYQQFGLTLLRPTDLIVHLDSLRRETEYQPARLAGTILELRLVQRGQQEMLTENFRSTEQGEKKADFQRQLRRLLSDPQRFECYVVQDAHSGPLALIAYDASHQEELSIPMFRLRRTPLAVTLMRYLSLHSIIRSVALRRMFTRVTDRYLDHRITRVLQEDAFVAIDNTWLKTNLGVAEPAGAIAHRLTELANRGGTTAPHYEKMVTLLRDDKATENMQAMVDIERLLWPVKIIDATIPTFMVPIRAHWAQELFDERLAAQTLFGAQLDLALNREAVYYRSSKPAVLTAPGRILWYVSQHGSYQGTGHIRACSRLDEVVVGKPKDLFRQFRRLGVYTWSNVLTVASHDMDRDIMALRFSNSELFAVPIPLPTLRRIIQDTGSNVQLQGPTRLSRYAFAEFYRAGMGLSKDLPSNASYD